ncbi:phosphoribosylaminoimidazolesuccinocarboxamide synthase [Carnobacterium pleistocenium]|uniref:phosphoribosylaminoimidazolesuccinocarboxamide synthase n=1 Tax=Carnobacterium pleistocenium TaxID=181073 RepID=UPI000557E712|nr:phosphoribosylaminoimidazolesuccinocarboxamide synthase [Carnobacterium pleistocenium]
MERKELIYTGKAKKMYATDQETVLLAEYLNQVTSLNGAKKETVEGKGELNNQITGLIFNYLAGKGIASHYIQEVSKTEQLIKRVEMIPLEVVVRNTSAGSFAKRFGMEEGIDLPFPILEFYYKKDELDDPFINDAHVKMLNVATDEEVRAIKKQALEINAALVEMFKKSAIRLIDFKIEFGKTADGEIVLADEISPDTCRLWDMTTKEHLDKDIYRRDLGDIIPVYVEVLERLKNI